MTSFGRFILGVEPGWDTERPLDDTRFPNLRSKMIQELHPGSEFVDDDVPPLHTISLRINRNTSLATISSIIRYPLDWDFLDRVAGRSRVLGITSVGIFNRAIFTLRNPDSDGMFIPISSGIRSAFVSRCTQHGAMEPQRTETCIRTLLQLLMPDAALDNVTWMDHQLQIQCNDPEDVRIWLQEVSSPQDCTNGVDRLFKLPSWLDINFNIEPSFKLFFECALTSHQFQDLTQGFVDMFDDLWTRGISARNRLFESDDDNIDYEARERVLCQIISFPPGDDTDEQYVARLIEYPERNGFRVLIQEYPPFPPPVEGSRVSPVRDDEVLEDRFYVPLGYGRQRASYLSQEE